MYQTPATIRHEGQRPQDYREGIIYVGKILGLSPQLTKLLALYADCKDGFTPAAKLIENKTGILKGNVARARRCLCNSGVIRYDANRREITVMWQKILQCAQSQPLMPGNYPDFSKPPTHSFANYVPGFDKYLPKITAMEETNEQTKYLSETDQTDRTGEFTPPPDDDLEDIELPMEDVTNNEDIEESFDNDFASEHY